MYKLINISQIPFATQFTFNVIRLSDNVCIPPDPANTDYQTFKTAVLDQQPGSSVVEDGDSFSINANPNDSILEDADGNVMTIDEAKAYVRTLP
jgi:hypothetical protein